MLALLTNHVNEWRIEFLNNFIQKSIADFGDVPDLDNLAELRAKIENIFYQRNSPEYSQGEDNVTKRILNKLVEGHNLTKTEMGQFMSAIMEGRATPAQIGAFLVAMRIKGETVDEITEAAKVMQAKAHELQIETNVPLVDTCGTGGDAQNTFNVSTITAFVIAGAGLKVAKHGNRSVSSQCGSADVLEALGLNLDSPPEVVKKSIEEVGIGFLFAPKFHPAMKYAIGPRRELGLRTIFNILGPLTNPTNITHQIMGVYDPKWLYPLAEVMRNLGRKGAMVVYGEGGYDEITITGKTYVAELKNGDIKQYQLSPEIVGLKEGKEEDIKGKDKTYNVRVLLDILSGKETGSKRDMVLINAAAVFKITGWAPDWIKGAEMALESIETGKAWEKLHQMLKIMGR
ncbi:MAG: Anthranilate phosphoribosyltransferase [Candidatus Methanoperedenaceae archaeon GB37]|nr:MAG: Anthranilate phosphoribosyltransferase [Candidatus Methanoperedenaceae archaeon GB37]CAD7776637.1 Anthranilate phosphoribosyltransferase [Candidatus Methanoperedenaceae archaeon GB37]